MNADELQALVDADPDARVACVENDLRRELAEAFDAARLERGLSFGAFAESMGTSISQTAAEIDALFAGT